MGCEEFVEECRKSELSGSSVYEKRGVYAMRPVKSRRVNIDRVRESRMRRVGLISLFSSNRRCSAGSDVNAILNAPFRITEARKSDRFAFGSSFGLSSPGQP